MRLDLDTPVRCVDGGFGELADVVIDPGTRRLTHLVVQPKHGHGLARLVSIDTVDDRETRHEVCLGCTIEWLVDSKPIQESAYLPPGQYLTGEADWDVGIQELFPLPQYGSLGTQALGAGIDMDYEQPVAVRYHRVPKGGIELGRESPVTSSDGDHVGHVVGFVVDEDGQIVHFILEHGHLWGKRHLAIPAGAIHVLETDGVTLSLSSDAVGDLKPVPRS